jgi:hypothetical protein
MTRPAMTRIVTGLFATRAAAEHARRLLLATGIPEARLGLHVDAQPSARQPATPDAPGGEGWLPALLDTLFLPEDDFAAHREALRRGGVVLSVEVADADAPAVAHALEAAGAEDFDAQEDAWRREGWSPATMAGAAANDPGAPATAMPGTGGMDREAARRAAQGASADAADPAGTAPDPQRLARRELGLGRTRSYVIEAPLAEQPDLSDQVANRGGPDRGAA